MKNHIMLKKFMFFIFLFIYFGANSVLALDNVIVIDPGHGGRQTGAVNPSLGLVQKDLGLTVARYIKLELQKYPNIQVILTHDGLGANEELSLQARADIAKKNNADMLICLHFNASGSNRQGAEIFVPYKDKFYKESKQFADIILENLANLGIVNTGVKTRLSETNTKYPDGTIADYYGIIRCSYLHNIPAILVEHCYIDSSDTKFIDSEEKLIAIAKADADAIIKYFGLKPGYFNDIAGHWAENQIAKMAEHGYVSGYNQKFNPDNGITRAEFVTLICNIFGYEKNAAAPFSDIKQTDWYYNAVVSAYHKNIVIGHDDKFYPNDLITREEVCVILTRLLNLSSGDPSAITRFTDTDDISSWAKNSVIAMVGKGLLTGTDKMKLLPRSSLSRAEAAVILERAVFD